MGVGALLIMGGSTARGKSCGYLTPGEVRDEEEVAAVEARPPRALLHAVRAAPQGSAPTAGGSDPNACSGGAATISPTCVCVQSCKEQSLLSPHPAVRWHPTCAGSRAAGQEHSHHIPSCASTMLVIALLLCSPKPGPPCHHHETSARHPAALLSAWRCCSSCLPPPSL